MSFILFWSFYTILITNCKIYSRDEGGDFFQVQGIVSLVRVCWLYLIYASFQIQLLLITFKKICAHSLHLELTHFLTHFSPILEISSISFLGNYKTCHGFTFQYKTKNLLNFLSLIPLNELKDVSHVVAPIILITYLFSLISLGELMITFMILSPICSLQIT